MYVIILFTSEKCLDKRLSDSKAIYV